MTTAWKARQQGPTFWAVPIVNQMVASSDLLGDINSSFEGGQHGWAAPAGITITVESAGGVSGNFLRFTNTSGATLTADVECLLDLPVNPTFWRGANGVGPMMIPRLDIRANGTLPTGVGFVFRFLDGAGNQTFGPVAGVSAVTAAWAPHPYGGARIATPLTPATTTFRVTLRLSGMPAGTSIDIDNVRFLTPRSNGTASLTVSLVHLEAHTRLNTKSSAAFDHGPDEGGLGTGGGPTLSTVSADPYAGTGSLRVTAAANAAWQLYTSTQMLATRSWSRARVRFALRKTGTHVVNFSCYSNGAALSSNPLSSTMAITQPGPAWTPYDFVTALPGDANTLRYDFGWGGSAQAAAGATLDIDDLLVTPIQSDGFANLTVVGPARPYRVKVAGAFTPVNPKVLMAGSGWQPSRRQVTLIGGSWS